MATIRVDVHEEEMRKPGESLEWGEIILFTWKVPVVGLSGDMASRRTERS